MTVKDNRPTLLKDIRLLDWDSAAEFRASEKCWGSAACLWLILMVEPVKKFAGGSALEHPIAHFDQTVAVHANQQASQLAGRLRAKASLRLIPQQVGTALGDAPFKALLTALGDALLKAFLAHPRFPLVPSRLQHGRHLGSSFSFKLIERREAGGAARPIDP